MGVNGTEPVFWFSEKIITKPACSATEKIEISLVLIKCDFPIKDKGTDQTARERRLVCAFVVRNSEDGFSRAEARKSVLPSMSNPAPSCSDILSTFSVKKSFLNSKVPLNFLNPRKAVTFLSRYQRDYSSYNIEFLRRRKQRADEILLKSRNLQNLDESIFILKVIQVARYNLINGTGC